MKTIFVVALICSLSLLAAEPAGGPPPEVMEKMQPGPEHGELKKREGKYDVAVKMWMDPKAPPQESKAKAEMKMVMNGKFLKQEYKGEMMGKPFTGIGYEGFDRVANKYTSTWLDDFSTQAMLAHGESKDGGKTIVFTGEFACPMTGGMVKYRNVYKQIDDDKFTFEMYQTQDGKESKGMELTYTRKK